MMGIERRVWLPTFIKLASGHSEGPPSLLTVGTVTVHSLTMHLFY
jgi:hypothetical protein